MKDQKIWLIRGGSAGEANDLFLQQNVIALNWREVGDLSEIPADRAEFYARVVAAFPEKGSGSHRNSSGQIYRFVHEMSPGDLVLYPSRVDGQVHVGRVTGAYSYATSVNADFPNRRPVTWLGSVPRNQFSPRARAEMGSIMTLFQVKRYANEVQHIVESLASAT